MLINLFYEHLNQQVFTQSPSYTLINLMSDTAGQLGFWIGLSFVGFLEICLVSVLILCVLLAASDAFDCHQVHNKIDLLNSSFTDYGDRSESCPAGDTTCVTLNGTYNNQNLLIKGCWTDFVSLNISAYIMGFTACSSSKQPFSHPNSKPPYNVDVYCCTKDNCNLSTILVANLLLIIVSVAVQIVNAC
uniref:UPAR/Ly6 domain-containing protein n=1 Tax=Acrobeloides nanus TaxID=290746 RepID=A0A914DQW7_9BILA